MNNFNELVSHGISEITAKEMLAGYKKRIGTMNGIFEIVDINYDFSDKGKDVTLKCSECGRIIHRTMISGRNKWSELIKSCDCQKERKKREYENSEKNKKDRILAEIGNIYGDYIVTGVQFGNPDKLIMECAKCGAEKQLSYQHVSSGKWKDRKCRKHYKPTTRYDESYIGRKNNFLTVVDIVRNQNNEIRLLCECDCGNRKMIQPCFWENGTVKSCGCKHDELNRTHGLSNERLYRIWRGMNQRCLSPKSISYDYYGGRGIQICDDWLGEEGLQNFYNWAKENGYSDELSIDRIDVSGNYEPSNCRWATSIEQANNRRPPALRKKRSEYERKRSVFWDINGVIKPALDWCEEYRISYATVAYRIKTKGMTPYEALTSAKITDGRPRKDA